MLRENRLPEGHAISVCDSSPADTSIPPRIVLITNRITPHFLPVLRRLSREIERFHVLASAPIEPDRSRARDWDGIDVTVQHTMTARRGRKFEQVFSLSSFRHLACDTLFHLYKHRPNVVISSHLGFRTMQAVAYRVANPNSRLVIWVNFSEHPERGNGNFSNYLRRWLLRVADSVVVNGQSGARYLQKLGVPLSRIVIAPYTTDPIPFTSIPLQRHGSAAKRVLFVGQLAECKGLLGFFDALDRWAARNPQDRRELLFVGDGPLLSELERYPLPARIRRRFLGNIPYEELPAHYAAAGMLVLPTLEDSWGMVVNEALAAGLPVLGSTHSQAVQQLVVDGRNGWTFCPELPDELDCALDCALSTSPERLAKMRGAARQSVTHLTPDVTAKRLLDAIRMAVRRRTDGAEQWEEKFVPENERSCWFRGAS